ncbi:hypothetical protein V2J09_020879 [Rumex salicifolius]
MEFGLSNLNKDFEARHRDRFIKLVYDSVYESAVEGGSGGGALVWQLFVKGMEDYHDDFAMVLPWESQTTYKLMTGQSCRMALLHGNAAYLTPNLNQLCGHRH